MTDKLFPMMKLSGLSTQILEKNPWIKEGFEWYNVLSKEVCVDQLLDKGKKFEEDFWTMKTSRKRKAYTTLEVAEVHKLDIDSDVDQSSGRHGAGTTSTISELSSHATRQSVTV
jgi:hypothetical protein